jgi:hypothetical protein
MSPGSRHREQFKGHFAQWYNRRHGRYGVLWADRFKSVLLEGGEALAAVAAQALVRVGTGQISLGVNAG